MCKGALLRNASQWQLYNNSHDFNTRPVWKCDSCTSLCETQRLAILISCLLHCWSSLADGELLWKDRSPARCSPPTVVLVISPSQTFLRAREDLFLVPQLSQTWTTKIHDFITPRFLSTHCHWVITLDWELFLKSNNLTMLRNCLIKLTRICHELVHGTFRDVTSQ